MIFPMSQLLEKFLVFTHHLFIDYFKPKKTSSMMFIYYGPGNWMTKEFSRLAGKLGQETCSILLTFTTFLEMFIGSK